MSRTELPRLTSVTRGKPTLRLLQLSKLQAAFPLMLPGLAQEHRVHRMLHQPLNKELWAEEIINHNPLITPSGQPLTSMVNLLILHM